MEQVTVLEKRNDMESLYNFQDEHDACGVGFVGNLDNEPQHQIVKHALTAMSHLAHRGGCDDDEKMSDGSGILMPIPRAFFGNIFPQMLNDKIHWGLGAFFLPIDAFLQENLLDIITTVAEKFSFNVAAVREVPTDISILSRKVLSSLPEFKHILFTYKGKVKSKEELETKLYVLRKQIEYTAVDFLTKQSRALNLFHISSLSTHSVVYKGILPGKNLGAFYTDLSDKNFTVSFAIFHERFSTNTKPSWHLCQPFRHVAHNGEINTIRSNKTQMSIRETGLASAKLGEDLAKVLPCIEPTSSDSGSFDNVFELLLHGGYDISHAIMTMIPEPTSEDFYGSKEKNDFYSYHMPLMEPWDGPTTMVFTDGHSKIGASLDRNGLRPCRYSVTNDNIIILSSEVGVLDLFEGSYTEHGQLSPRSLMMVDFEKGKILFDEEIKEPIIHAHDYSTALNNKKITLSDEKDFHLSEVSQAKSEWFDLFCFCEKMSENTIVAMVNAQEEPVAAMGLDTPWAVLSHKPHSLFNYFKQLFAQVTNPSIDSIREKLSMSLTTVLGGKANLFQNPKDLDNYIYLDHPFLHAKAMNEIETNTKVPTEKLSISIPFTSDFAAFETKLTSLCDAAEKAVTGGKRILILSDKDASCDTMPMPALLAAAAVHQDLIRKKLRHQCDIIIETGQAYEVMHMALLLSFGANAIYPFGAYNAINQYVQAHKVNPDYDYEKALKRYYYSLEKGLLKVFGRLGISTLSSFAGAQCFEVLGIHSSVIDTYFTGTYSRIGGVQLEDIYKECQSRYAYCVEKTGDVLKADKRLWSKPVRSSLRDAVVSGNFKDYEKYEEELLAASRGVTLRSVWRYKETSSIALENVEPAENIYKRFVSAAMSLGALSQESHECIAEGFNNLGLLSNCGEGGEEVARTLTRGSAKDICSRVRQIASGRFGVTAEYLAAGDEVQIKIAQGAKPGEGGQLPGHKVTEYIAKVRHTQAGVSLISPPPHHDIYSIEDLAQLIFDIKKLKKGMKVSVKLVAEAGIGTVAVGVVKAGADSICISGHDGGTGAAPASSIYHVGLPWELGIAEVHQALIANAMRHRVTLQVDGLIQSGRDVAIAFMLGAEEVLYGTSLLVAMGCIMCRQCFKGVCPVGICTQEHKLRAKFPGTAEHIENYLKFIAEDTRKHMALLGVSNVDELIGCADILEMDEAYLPEKAHKLDMSLLLQRHPYAKRLNHVVSKAEFADWEIQIASKVRSAIENNESIEVYSRIKNVNRAVATDIAGMMALSYKEFEDDAIRIHYTGTAGQSFGAFAPQGLSLYLEGNANDYIGKGLCGGKISIAPFSPYATYLQDFSIIGNVALYGATSGKAFICGKAGDRFAVRNSGAYAVVEGISDHGCEYMTGGVVVNLGTCGYNLAAGMSGGVLYAYDPHGEVAKRCNSASVAVDPLQKAEDRLLLKAMLEEHVYYTQSYKAKNILSDFDRKCDDFVKVIPHEVKNTLEHK